MPENSPVALALPPALAARVAARPSGLVPPRRAAGRMLSVLLPALWACAGSSRPAPAPTGTRPVPLDARALVAYNVEVAAQEYLGRRAVRLLETPRADSTRAAGASIALVPGAHVRNGTVEILVAGRPRAGAGEGARGFVGIAFHVQPSAARFKAFYVRPTNGRADDQLRRNRSTQYIALPDWPWPRLRREQPGVYESYVDLVPGEWTRLRVVVRGRRAELYVHDAPQPVLVVNDMKYDDAEGGVALWVGSEAEAYFADLRISRDD